MSVEGAPTASGQKRREGPRPPQACVTAAKSARFTIDLTEDRNDGGGDDDDEEPGEPYDRAADIGSDGDGDGDEATQAEAAQVDAGAPDEESGGDSGPEEPELPESPTAPTEDEPDHADPGPDGDGSDSESGPEDPEPDHEPAVDSSAAITTGVPRAAITAARAATLRLEWGDFEARMQSKQAEFEAKAEAESKRLAATGEISPDRWSAIEMVLDMAEHSFELEIVEILNLGDHVLVHGYDCCHDIDPPASDTFRCADCGLVAKTKPHVWDEDKDDLSSKSDRFNPIIRKFLRTLIAPSQRLDTTTVLADGSHAAASTAAVGISVKTHNEPLAAVATKAVVAAAPPTSSVTPLTTRI
jgi:hypothetical protein